MAQALLRLRLAPRCPPALRPVEAGDLQLRWIEAGVVKKRWNVHGSADGARTTHPPAGRAGGRAEGYTSVLLSLATAGLNLTALRLTRLTGPGFRPFSSTGRTSRPGSAPTRTPRRSAAGSSPGSKLEHRHGAGPDDAARHPLRLAAAKWQRRAEICARPTTRTASASRAGCRSPAPADGGRDQQAPTAPAGAAPEESLRAPDDSEEQQAGIPVAYPAWDDPAKRTQEGEWIAAGGRVER